MNVNVKKKRKHDRRPAVLAPILAALLSSALHAQDPALAAAALAAQHCENEPAAMLVTMAALASDPARFAGKRVAVELSGHLGERVHLIGRLKPSGRSEPGRGWVFVGERVRKV